MTKTLEPVKTSENTPQSDANFAVMNEVLTTLTTYANKHGLKIYGFSKDFTEAVFVRMETNETVRVPYDQLKAEVAELIEA